MKLTNEQIEQILNDAPESAKTYHKLGPSIETGSTEDLREILSLRKENEDLKSRLSRNYDAYKKIEEVKQAYNAENKLLRKELEQTKKELEAVINEESDGVNGVV